MKARNEEMIYWLGLGGNVGDPVRNLGRVRRLLGRFAGKVRRVSSLYLTEPVGPRNQPWFLNQVLEIESRLSPAELLAAVKSIERRMKRVPGPRNGPRIIDIDILLAGRTVIRTADLVLPHPRLAARRFVLAPLAEIAARRRHPVLGKTIAALERACPDRSIVVRLPIRGESPG
jgi:2-amino-4-hydroxy-6-hydroxymethyldihydropteridine diphosphokinase